MCVILGSIKHGNRSITYQNSVQHLFFNCSVEPAVAHRPEGGIGTPSEEYEVQQGRDHANSMPWQTLGRLAREY